MIFLSYSWRYYKLAHKLEKSLIAQGLVVWMDYREINSTSEILPQLDNAIQNCTSFVSLNVIGEVESQWMQIEADLSKKYSKPKLEMFSQQSCADIPLVCKRIYDHVCDLQ